MTATVDSLAASWTAPTHGAVTSYTVTLKEDTTTKDTKTGVTETTVTFDSLPDDKKLTAGTEYTVEVVSVAGVLNSGGQSSDSPLSGNFYTSKSDLDCLFHLKI